MDIPVITNLELSGKNVLVRGDLDVDDLDNPRIESVREIIKFCQSKGSSKIKIIAHRETDFDVCLSLRQEFPGVEFDDRLRDNSGEKTNDIEFARMLAVGWDVYINEAFATSHREHASIISLPKIIKESGGQIGLGLRFEKEIDNLSKVFNNPERPVVILISGLKEDKLSYVEPFCEFADKVLIAGRLPELIQNTIYNIQNTKLLVADLIADKEDITIRSIEKFEEEIENAGTIVVSGPPGKFEDEGHRLGTKRVFEAIIKNTKAFKIAGGGDTERALQIIDTDTLLRPHKRDFEGQADKDEERNGFDWISVGGGAMLEFLSKKTLPGIEAIR